MTASGCLGVSTPFPLPTNTPLPPPSTSTPTTVWFPATSTPTPYSTPERSPTPDLSPLYGDQLFVDDFSRQGSWTTGLEADGNIAVGNQALSLSVSSPKGMLISLRNEPVMSDFYVEITATPNLCKAEDTFGLLFWSLSEKIYYRYALTCTGMFRVERVDGKTITPLIDWTASGQVSRGPQDASHIAIWSGGGQLRFYAGGIYQDYVVSPKTGAGVFGVFAQAAGTSPVSVSFSDMAAYDVNAGFYMPTFTPIPSPTRTPRPDIPTLLPTSTHTPRPGSP